MRFALLAVLLVACAPQEEDDIPYRPLPDAYTDNCGIGDYQIKAPVDNLHYSPHLIVYIDIAEIDLNASDFSMIDDLGNSYAFTSSAEGVGTPDPPLWRRDSYTYELLPSHRYVLTVRHCDQTRQVTFFTSAS